MNCSKKLHTYCVTSHYCFPLFLQEAAFCQYFASNDFPAPVCSIFFHPPSLAAFRHLSQNFSSPTNDSVRRASPYLLLSLRPRLPLLKANALGFRGVVCQKVTYPSPVFFPPFYFYLFFQHVSLFPQTETAES